MATVGDIVSASNVKRAICLMTAQATNVAAPTLATQGVPCYPPLNAFSSADAGAFYQGDCPDLSTLFISSSAGSGTMVGTFTLYGYLTATATWYPITVNGAAALAETATDSIRFSQTYTNLGHYDRLYLSLASIGGTATAFEAYLVSAMTRRI